MKRPLISVVIPTYNRSKVIGRCIENILCQDYENFEIIVVDDGSSDQTQEVVGKYLDKITYLRQENSGAGAARNAGAMVANGEWIAYQDSDDVWMPDKLSRQVEAISAYPDADVISSNLLIYREHLKKEVNWFEFIGFEQPSLKLLDNPFKVHLEKRFAWLQASLIRKEKLLSVGLNDPSLSIFIDLDLLLRIALDSNWVVTGDVVARILREDDGNNISQLRKNDPKAAVNGMIKIFNKIERGIIDASNRKLLMKYIGNSYNSLGNIYVGEGDYGSARASYGRALQSELRLVLFLKWLRSFLLKNRV
jgi:glycosyltransferase involved in cell wall biosynthesis